MSFYILAFFEGESNFEYFLEFHEENPFWKIGLRIMVYVCSRHLHGHVHFFLISKFRSYCIAHICPKKNSQKLYTKISNVFFLVGYEYVHKKIFRRDFDPLKSKSQFQTFEKSHF